LAARPAHVPDAAGRPTRRIGAVRHAERRLPNGNTVVAGNGSNGAFLWEFDSEHRAIPERRLHVAGIEKVRMVRRTATDTYLFCSETDGRSVIHEADFRTGCRALFEVPKDAPADSMVKAVRVTDDVIVVSTGYAASLLRIAADRGTTPCTRRTASAALSQ
jgi:hypothetical protein